MRTFLGQLIHSFALALPLWEAFSEIPAVGSTHFPYDRRPYDAPKVRFSDKVGEEPEIEVGLG